jgi:hypothetical protein
MAERPDHSWAASLAPILGIPIPVEEVFLADDRSAVLVAAAASAVAPGDSRTTSLAAVRKIFVSIEAVGVAPDVTAGLMG